MKNWVYVTKGVGVKLSIVLVKVSQALSDLVEYRGFGCYFELLGDSKVHWSCLVLPKC